MSVFHKVMHILVYYSCLHISMSSSSFAQVWYHCNHYDCLIWPNQNFWQCLNIYCKHCIIIKYYLGKIIIFGYHSVHRLKLILFLKNKFYYKTIIVLPKFIQKMYKICKTDKILKGEKRVIYVMYGTDKITFLYTGKGFRFLNPS